PHRCGKRRPGRRQRVRQERLEQRVLLASDLVNPEVAQYVFASSVDDEAYRDAAEQFTLATEYDATSGLPTAVLRLREDLAEADIDTGLQEIRLALTRGPELLETQVILVDIAEPDFLRRLDASRRDKADAVVGQVIETSDSLGAGAPVDVEALLESRESTLGGNDPLVAATYYRAFANTLLQTIQRLETATSLPDYEAATAAREALSSGGVLLADQLRSDLVSPTPELAAAAAHLADTLRDQGLVHHSMFSGYGGVQELDRAASPYGNFEHVLSLVEQPSYSPFNSLRVEIGDRPAMVQATIVNQRVAVAATQTANSTLAQPAVQSVTLTTDGSEGTDSQTISVAPDGSKVGLVWFDLNSEVGHNIKSSSLGLTQYSGPAELSPRVSTHWDAWGLTIPQASFWAGADNDTSTAYHDASDGFRSLNAFQTANSATSITSDVSATVARTLLAGDANLDGRMAPLDDSARGDIEAAYMAVTDWDRYLALYGDTTTDPGTTDDALRQRVDIDWDGDVDRADFSYLAARLGFYRGDFNLDGFLDGYDYAVYTANLGAEVSLYQHGDADANGLVSSDDFLVFLSSIETASDEQTNPAEILFGDAQERHRTPLDTQLLFRIESDSATGTDVSYHPSGTTNAPTLEVSSRTGYASLLAFNTTDDLGLGIEYESAGMAPTTRLVIQQVLADGTSTVLHELGSLDSASNAWRGIATDGIDFLPKTDEAYSLRAAIMDGGQVLAWRDLTYGIVLDSDGDMHAFGSDEDDFLSIADGGGPDIDDYRGPCRTIAEIAA
ncbi:MAG: hypothetical protein AAF266_16215, partial [Planctomycetota bacterium]